MICTSPVGMTWDTETRRGHLLITLTFLQLIAWSTPFPALTGSGPLYGPNDFVYVLNASTIQNMVFYSDRAWLVEFFSSWCGHCVQFAPVWKQFATDLKEWRSMVMVAGIDCADDLNVGSCREFEIMGYPTLKLFPKNAKRNVTSEGKSVLNTGEVFQRPNSMVLLKNNLIDALIPMFPQTLVAFNESFSKNLLTPKSFWENPEFSNGAQFLLLVYENSDSHAGLEVALRLSNYQKSVRVVRFNEKNPMYLRLSLDGWPAAGYISKDGTFGSLILGNNQDIIDLLTKAVIGLAQITQIEELPWSEVVGETHKGLKGSGGGALENYDNIPSNLEDKVSTEDLLHTVRNLLRNEVGLLQKIDGPKLVALKNFVSILSQYFPSDRREVQVFLVKLSDWIRHQREIENYKYLEKLNDMEAELNPWDIDMNIWYDCRPTVPGRRGYSCGLWRLFHTLTVIGLEKHEDTQILPAIHGYVREFFGCKECAKHFDEMVERDNALQLRSIRDQTHWLWKAHNEVNLRLIGTPSEDPAFPKIKYPSSEHCPECYIINDFDEGKVEEYLLRVYSRPERYMDKMDSDTRRNRKNMNGTASKLSSSSWMGGLFSLADMGIFMMLYFSIVLLLVFAYIHFKVARRRRYDPIFCLHRAWSKILKTSRFF